MTKDYSSLEKPFQEILRTISEVATVSQDRNITISIESLRLRSLIRESRITELPGRLQKLEADGWISIHSLESGPITLSLSNRTTLPEADDSQREIVHDRSLHRVILFKLFEEYRRVGYRQSARYRLVNLCEPLGIQPKSKIGAILDILTSAA